MHPQSTSDPDLVEALVARVDEIDEQVRAATAALDEKSLKEFRRTLDALAKRDAKFEERLANKVGVATDRLETLARTVSTTSAALAAKDGEIAQLRRELDGAGTRLDAALAEMRRGLDPAPLNDVKRTLAELSKQKLPRGLDGRVDELGAKLTMLAQRIDTVSSTVSTTAAGLAGREGDLIALRRAHETSAERIAAELAELRRAVDPAPLAELRQAISELRERHADARQSLQLVHDETSAKVDTLAGRLDSIATSLAATTAAVRAGDEQVSTLEGNVEENGIRLTTLAAAIEAASERIQERDVELETLERRFHDASARVDGLVAELSRALEEFPDPASTERFVEARLSELDRNRVNDRVRVEEVADRLEALAASIESLMGNTPEIEALEHRVDWLAEQADVASHERSETSGELARLAAVLEVERSAVRTRLDSLAASQEGALGAVSADELRRRMEIVDGRVEEIERERDALAARVGGLTSAFDTERTSFQTQLEALATALSWTSPKSTVDERLDELDRRMEGLARQGAAVASRVTHATTLLPTALRSLEARLDELAPETRGTTAAVSASPPLSPELGPSPFDADDRHDGADAGESPLRLPTPVVPVRGTDP